MKRVISILFATALILWLCVSAHFLAFEAGHDCHDENECPICVCIQICTSMQKNMSNALIAAIVIIVFAAINTYRPLFRGYIYVADTPVTQKIRLND